MSDHRGEFVRRLREQMDKLREDSMVVPWRDAFEAGARAALLLAAEDLEADAQNEMDNYKETKMGQFLGAADSLREQAVGLRTRASELGGGNG